MQTTWDERYRELSTYRSTWGTADAPLGDPLGRWCRTQRQQHAEGKLSDERVAKLEADAIARVRRTSHDSKCFIDRRDRAHTPHLSQL